jgi:hypothetical protein
MTPTTRKRDARNCGLRARTLTSALTAFLLLCAPRLDAYQTSLDHAALHDAFVLGQRNDQSTGDFLAPYIKQITEGQTTAQHVAEIEILTPFAQAVDDSRKNSAGYTEQQAQQGYQRRGNTIEVSVTLMLPSAYPQPANGNGATSSPNPAGSNSSAPNMPQGPTTPPPTTAAPANPSPTDQPNQATSPAPAPSAAHVPSTAANSTAGTAPMSQASTNLKPENFWQKFQFYFKQNGKNIPSKSLLDKPIYSTATTSKPSVLTGTSIWITFDAKDVVSQETVIEVVTPDGQTTSATFDLKKLR